MYIYVYKHLYVYKYYVWYIVSNGIMITLKILRNWWIVFIGSYLEFEYYFWKSFSYWADFITNFWKSFITFIYAFPFLYGLHSTFPTTRGGAAWVPGQQRCIGRYQKRECARGREGRPIPHMQVQFFMRLHYQLGTSWLTDIYHCHAGKEILESIGIKYSWV